jgi:hypothetical protein
VSRWGVASGGCKPEVKKLPLKGTGEARCKPPRGRAWLRGRMVSANEAGFNLRERLPLPRNILHSLALPARVIRGSGRIQRSVWVRRMTEDGHGHVPSQRMPRVNWSYPLAGRDTAKSGMGCVENRHLNDLAESIAMNVGGPCVEGSSPPMKRTGVGGSIVVR